MNSTINSYQCMSKTKKVWLNIFLIWIFVSGTTLFFVDMIMSATKPAYATNYPDYTWGDTLDNQTLWLSVWCALALTIFALLNFLSLYFKGMGRWVSSKENWTFILSISIFMFLVWTPDAVGKMVAGQYFRGVAYKPTRGLIEHWLNPILLLAVYFVYAKDFVSSKNYASSKSWYIEIFLIAYLLWNITRELLMKYHPELFSFVMMREPFPYKDFVNPIPIHVVKHGVITHAWDGSALPAQDIVIDVPAVPVWQWVSIMIAYLIMPWAFQIFFNAMSNINNSRLSNRTQMFRK